MLRENLINTARWLDEDARNAYTLVYSCLDNSPAVINAVLTEICAPVDDFWRIVLEGM